MEELNIFHTSFFNKTIYFASTLLKLKTNTFAKYKLKDITANAKHESIKYL